MEYKGYYYTITPDNVPFTGGYYCEVFKDEDKEILVDDFFLHGCGEKASARLRGESTRPLTNTGGSRTKARMIGNMEYKGYYISTTPDVGPNQGGYYCQVYDDEDMENQIDDFCIHPEELEVNPDIDYWIHSYIDGLVPNEGPSMNLK